MANLECFMVKPAGKQDTGNFLSLKAVESLEDVQLSTCSSPSHCYRMLRSSAKGLPRLPELERRGLFELNACLAADLWESCGPNSGRATSGAEAEYM